MNHLKMSEISFLNLTLTLSMNWFKITFEGENPRLLELQREDCLSQVPPGNLKFCVFDWISWNYPPKKDVREQNFNA